MIRARLCVTRRTSPTSPPGAWATGPTSPATRRPPSVPSSRPIPLPASTQADVEIDDLAGTEDSRISFAALRHREFENARLEMILSENFSPLLRRPPPE